MLACSTAHSQTAFAGMCFLQLFLYIQQACPGVAKQMDDGGGWMEEGQGCCINKGVIERKGWEEGKEEGNIIKGICKQEKRIKKAEGSETAGQSAELRKLWGKEVLKKVTMKQEDEEGCLLERVRKQKANGLHSILNTVINVSVLGCYCSWHVQ